MLQVRRATALDLEWIVNELREFSRFYGTKRELFGSSEHAGEVVTNLIEHHVVLVAEKEGDLHGFIAGYLTPHPFNPEIRVLHEAFWWVPGRHRGTRAGATLLEEFMRIGEAEANWVSFTLEANSPVSERALIKRGFQPQERTFLKEVS